MRPLKNLCWLFLPCPLLCSMLLALPIKSPPLLFALSPCHLCSNKPPFFPLFTNGLFLVSCILQVLQVIQKLKDSTAICFFKIY